MSPRSDAGNEAKLQTFIPYKYPYGTGFHLSVADLFYGFAMCTGNTRNKYTDT